ncbi:hypothetical protein KM539_08520 [Xanthomonas translucens pv. poae]|nr:hypothetical protein [Xanthomonas translucens]UKE63465.1 hypothetical protein KM539_08520 [Xanthomonas translucens pv. poae]
MTPGLGTRDSGLGKHKRGRRRVSVREGCPCVVAFPSPESRVPSPA